MLRLRLHLTSHPPYQSVWLDYRQVNKTVIEDLRCEGHLALKTAILDKYR